MDTEDGDAQAVQVSGKTSAETMEERSDRRLSCGFPFLPLSFSLYVFIHVCMFVYVRFTSSLFFSFFRPPSGPLSRRGCHVVTRELISQLGEVENMSVGLANFFIQHTSASLTMSVENDDDRDRSDRRGSSLFLFLFLFFSPPFSNENASPDVPLDLNDSLDRLVPDGDKMRYRHDDEGPDDMPAHVKSSEAIGPREPCAISFLLFFFF